MALVIVSGASGQHAAVVYEAAILSRVAVAGYAAIDGAGPAALLDCPPLGLLDDMIRAGIDPGRRFIVACGSNRLRRVLSERILAVGPRAAIGRGAIVNHAACVDHDCRVGDHANISPGARLAGCVRIGDEAFVGLNASVIQGLCIGSDAVVGAGAVVLRDVGAGETVVGVPARPISRRCGGSPPSAC